MVPRLTAIIATATALLSTVPSAVAEPPRAVDRASETVTLQGLDLTSAAGVAEAARRIDVAARHACRTFTDTRRVSDRETYADCIRDARLVALHQLDSRVPTAVAGTRETSRP